MNEKINSLKIYRTGKKETSENESKYHQHKKGLCGASDSVYCRVITSLKEAGITLPKGNWFQQLIQVFELGNLLHSDIQTTIKDVLKEKQLEHIFYGSEVFISLVIVEGKGKHILDGYGKPRFDVFGVPIKEGGLCIESPIDNAYATKPFIKVKWQFQDFIAGENNTEPITIKHKDAKWIQIGDIKSASQFGFSHLLEEEYSLGYLAQFHIYMKATELKSLYIFGKAKESGLEIYNEIKWDEKIWEKTVNLLKRRLELTQQIETWLNINVKHKKVLEVALETKKWNAFAKFFDSMPTIKKEDLCLFAGYENIDWWSCPLCEISVIEKFYNKGAFTQRLIKPCYWIEKQIYIEAKSHFIVGSLWKRRDTDITVSISKAITITKYEKNIVYVETVDTRYPIVQYQDTVIFAFLNYQPQVASNWRNSTIITDNPFEKYMV